MEMQEEFSSFRRIFYFSVFPLSAMVRFTSALYASVPSIGLRASQLVAGIAVVVGVAAEIYFTHKFKDKPPNRKPPMMPP